MVFIWEVQEATRHTTLLEDVEQQQTLRDGETEVQIVMDDEMGSCPVVDVVEWVEFLVVVAVVPDCTVEL